LLLPDRQIGYAGGIDQTLQALGIMGGNPLHVLFMIFVFKSAAEVQFETREEEQRIGIINKF
jgi:hypothetical protein